MREPMTSRAATRAASDIRVRRATTHDWTAVEALLEAAGLPLDGAHEHLDDFVVAERDGSPIGCAAVERYGDAGLLRSVAVAASERGRGIGVALVERSLADARAAGVVTVILLTTTAEGFFPRFGFEVIDRSIVPDAVRDSAEFRGACPASATVMRVALASAGRKGDALAR
jgi:N-acetylglutamate synthase-like GNAT family acetyltransferase